MAEWIHTSWSSWDSGIRLGTRFTDLKIGGVWCRWHRWSRKENSARRRRVGGAREYHRSREYGRRPYVDGSRWGIKSHTEKRNRPMAQEKGLVFEKRRSRGKKI